MVLPVIGGAEERGWEPAERLGPRDRQPLGEGELGGGESHPVQGRDKRDLAAAGLGRELQALESLAQPLGPELEVGLLGEDVTQQRTQRRTDGTEPSDARDLGSGAGQIPFEPVEGPGAGRPPGGWACAAGMPRGR